VLWLKQHIFYFSYDAQPFRFSPVLLFIVQLLLTPVQGTTRKFRRKKKETVDILVLTPMMKEAVAFETL